jgi:dTDP-4-dehydrorhamnose reductase
MPSPTQTRILLTGATGQLGRELLHTLAPLGEIIAPSRVAFDLTDTASIQIFLRSHRPHWIVNAAAYTAVDQAETNQPLAFAINADAVRTIGLEARAIDATVLHFSTDYVFDGLSSSPYVETDQPNPINVYGASKRAGEQALLQTGANALIFRTSWVFGATGKNFLNTIIKLAQERATINVVDDQHGAPTWSRDLARMTAHIIATGNPTPGIYHAAAAGETTWAGFAIEALRQLALRKPSENLATITPVPTSDYPTPAARPANSRLNCNKLAQTFDWRMMDWRQSLSQVIDEILAQ